jgi:hypothetical protein
MAVFTSIGAAIFGAGTFLAGVTAAGLQIAAGVAASLIGKAMQGEPEPPRFGVQGKLQAGEDVPRSINVGWNCTAGSLSWHHTFGNGGTMSARVIAIGDLPIRELLYPIVDGVDCTLLKAETHASYGWPVAEYRKAGQDHLWIKFYDGTQSSADAVLVSTFGSDPDRPYQATRVGRGIPYVIVFARAPERNDEGDKPLFQGIPELKFVTNGVRWYNPAFDTTAGGSGANRWDNPATWGGVGDFNPIVQLYNLLRGVRYTGQWLYGMQALSAARLPAASWIAGINAAQAAIAGPGGEEPTYRAGGEIQIGAQVATTVEALMTAANARLVESGGTYKIFVGPPGTPVMAFTDGDILSTEEQSFSPFLSLADTVNGVDATYPNPAEGWNAKKAPPLLRPDLEPLAGNRRLIASVSLDLVPYSGQAQRLMQWALLEALRARRHTFVLGPEFRVLEAGDIVLWSSARNGYEDKLFRVDGLVYKSNLDVIVDLTEVDPSDYDWDQEADYTPVIDGPLTLVGPKPMPMTGWQVFPWEIVDDQGRARRPSILVQYASGVPSVDRVRVQVRVGDENGPLIFDSDAHPYGTPWSNVLQGQFPGDTPVVVRGIFIGPPASEWSGWFAITTPDVKLGALDVIYGDIDLDGLGAQVENLFAQFGRSLREVYEQLQAQAELTGDQELANSAQFNEMRRSLTTVVGTLSATFDETITTAIVPIEGELVAIADALTELSAGDGDDVSTARFRMTVQSGDAGGVTIGAQGRTGTVGAWRDAGWFLRVPNLEADPTQFLVIADQFAVASSASAARFNPFIFEDGTLRVSNAFIGDLTAVNIDVNALTATAGFFDNLEATWAQIDSAVINNFVAQAGNIGDLTVGTIKIPAGAVSTVYSSVAASDVNLPSGSPNSVTVASVNVPVTFGQVVVNFILIVAQGGSSNGNLSYELRKNGVAVRSGSCSVQVGQTLTLSGFFNDSSPGASDTWSLFLAGSIYSLGTGARAGSGIIATNNKR